jgi:hypothetical protein
MTIYDQDYMAEFDQQQKHTGVVDSAAVSPEVVEQEQVSSQEPIVSASNDSEKEYNFKALRDSIAQEKAEREAEKLRYSQELEFMRSQIAMQQQPAQKRSPLEDERDDDLLTVGKYKQTQAEYEQALRQQEENYRLKLNELETKVQNPDYDEVMDKYAIPLLKTNRDFAIAFQNSENKASFAYNLGRMHRDSQRIEPAQPREPEVSQKAQRIVENSSKPGTLSSARGGQPSLSKAEYYASMSESEFNALVEKNLTEV